MSGIHHSVMSAGRSVGPISLIGTGPMGGPASSPTLTVPSGIIANDLLVAVVASGVAIATPSGWTAAASGGANYSVFFKVATGSETTVGITAANSQTDGVVFAWRGLTNVPDTVQAADNSALGSAATSSITTTGANGLVLSVFQLAVNTAGTWTPPASTSLAFSTTSSGRQWMLCYEYTSAGATTARTGTNSQGSSTMYARAIAFK